MEANDDLRSEEEQSQKCGDGDGNASGKRRRGLRACDVGVRRCRWESATELILACAVPTGMPEKKDSLRWPPAGTRGVHQLVSAPPVGIRNALPLTTWKALNAGSASFGYECTFATAVKRRAPPMSYVLALEARMSKAEQVIMHLAPYIDLIKVIGPMPVLANDTMEREEPPSAICPTALLKTPSGPHVTLTAVSACPMQREKTLDVEEDEEDEDAAYMRVSMQNVNLSDEMPNYKVATSSQNCQTSKEKTAHLKCKANESIEATVERTDPGGGPGADAPISFLGSASNFHILPLLDKLSQSANKATTLCSADEVLAGVFKASREETVDCGKTQFALPEYDLQQKLISAYFARHNHDLPILNEVVTRRLLGKPSREWEDSRTIAIALGIFCVASRHVDDPRLNMSDGSSAAQHWHTTLSRLLKEDFARSGTPMMFIQAMLLSIVYSSAVPKTAFVHCWVSLGAVVRMLEDCGAHRKFTAKRLGYSLLAEETYKRLWWVTYVLDRQLSADLGRPMAIQDEDFDVDEILLVDDEFLVEAAEHQTKPVQPPGRICVYGGFLQIARLSQVIGRTLRIIYAISKSKISRGFFGHKWDAEIVADIDRSLSKWLEGLPSYLRYSPEGTDTETLLQSSRVLVQYYYTQTLIHRPFIESGRLNYGDLKFKSLAIVSNASRSAIHIFHDLQYRGLVSYSNADVPYRVFEFGCILLFIGWSAYANNLRVSQSIMGDVSKCLDIFQALQSRWTSARNMERMMQIIIKRSKVLGSGTEHHSSKRGYEDSTQSADFSASSVQPDTTQHATTDNQQVCLSHMALPLSTTDLQAVFGGSPTSPESFSSTSSAPLRQPSASSQKESSNDVDGAGQDSLDEAGVGSYLTSRWRNNVIDPTMYEPTSHMLEAFSRGEMTQSSFDVLASTADGSGMSGAGIADALGESDMDEIVPFESHLMLGSTAGHPLDARINMQSLWSESDWMRAFEHQM